MNKLIISILLLCTALWPCRAQVNPDGKPGLTWDVAEVAGNRYTSLSEAFEKVTIDGATVRLLMGVTQEKALSVSYTTTLDLNNLPLVCASGTSFEIADTKVLTWQNGIVSGSLQLAGKGNLFADEDVKITSLGVTSSSGESLFRILVELPGDENDGTVSEVFYGNKTVVQYARQGKVLCCWLPQSVETLSLTYKYTKGSTPLKYTTSSLIVTQHASKAVSSTVAQAGGGNVAQVGDVSYTTLPDAFNAVKSSGGTITLLDNTTLSTQVQPEKPVTLDLGGWGLATTGLASVDPGTDGSLWIKNGLLSGSLTIGEHVTAEKTVTLTAAITQNSKPVYRTRLLLPSAASSETLSYTYGDLSGTIPTLVTEDSKQVAYLWLPTHTSAPFVLTLGSTTKTKYSVTIQTNHSNEIDLQQGDIEAILYKSNETPGQQGVGTPYETFHDALNEAGRLNGSQVWLQRNVSFSGNTDHKHMINENVITELHLNGYTMSASNCTLDASAPGACLRICDADKGSGSITGNFRIKGNVYIGKDVNAGKIGTVLDESKQNLYRVLLFIDNGTSLNGLATYKVDKETVTHACYIQNGIACIWLPADGKLHTLTLTVSSTEYAASNITVSATHSNTVTVRKPAVVATIDGTEYTSLADAFTQAASGNTITLKQSTTLSSVVDMVARNLTLDLQEFTLKMDGAAGFASSGSGYLLVKSSNIKGTISGNFTVTESVCVDESVSISNQVQLNGKWVYRVCFYLPSGTTAGTWTYSSQNGTLFFSGKSNTNQAIAYAWLQSESGLSELKTELTAPTSFIKTLSDITIQSNHYNRFDMEAGTNQAKVDGQFYNSFKLALVEANKSGGTIQLVKDQPLRDLQEIKASVTVDLNGHALSLTADASFKVEDGKSLRIADLSGSATKGFLYGNLLTNGLVYIDPDIKLSGTVVREGQEVSRLLVKDLPEEAVLTECEFTLLAENRKEKALWLNNTACLWIPTTAAEDELLFTKDGTIYEASLPATLSGYSNEQKAYKRIEVSSDETWSDDTNKDCNVLLAPGATLTIDASAPFTLHRITMGNGSQVITEKNILATGGIVHRRAFDAARVWEPFSLPYEAKRITAVVDGKIIDLSPNLSNGSGGHFWLQMLASDGSFRHVAEETLRANVGYIIAVPEGLTTANGQTAMSVSFASAPNQYLKRTEVKGTAPTEKGFRSFATGLLKDMKIPTAFYQLDADGKEYVRQAAGGTVSPFSSYLLADAQTTATTRSLRLDNLPTSNETVTLPDQSAYLVFGGKGYIKVVAKTTSLIQIFTPDGRLKQISRVEEGDTHLPISSGLYIVNRRKVYVTE